MSVLKKVYDATSAADARQLRGLLESEGIPAVVRGAGLLSFLPSGLLPNGRRPSVWVLEGSRFARALQIAHDYRTRPDEAAAGAVPPAGTAPTAILTCPACGESMEQQSGDCGNCGGQPPPRAAASAPPN